MILMMMMMVIVCEKEVCVLCAGVSFVFVCERLIEREEFGETGRAKEKELSVVLCDFLTVNPNTCFLHYV